MRHKKKRNKLSRDKAHRSALLSNLSKQLIEHERIQTSQAKAKAVKPEVEKLITLAKRGDLRTTLIMLFLIGTFGLNFPIFVSTMAVFPRALFDEVGPR